MRRLFTMLCLLVLFAPLAACATQPGCGPTLPSLPAITLRNPLELFYEPQTVPGARLIAVPAAVQYAVPTYTPAPGACSCSPGASLPGYTFSTPAPAASPCAPPGGAK